MQIQLNGYNLPTRVTSLAAICHIHYELLKPQGARRSDNQLDRRPNRVRLKKRQPFLLRINATISFVLEYLIMFWRWVEPNLAYFFICYIAERLIVDKFPI